MFILDNVQHVKERKETRTDVLRGYRDAAKCLLFFDRQFNFSNVTWTIDVSKFLKLKVLFFFK